MVSWNFLTWVSEFWPEVPSSTKSDSVGGLPVLEVIIFSILEICNIRSELLESLPAVSIITISTFLSLAKSRAENTTLAGSSWSDEKNIEFDLLNSKEKMDQNIFSGQVNKGDRIFKIDTTLIKNGTYFISVKTPHQSILRKIAVKN